ncbi:MAG TPA: DUF167 domain-containing protein [Opitutaceae bacterium]|nr:DUF167 domain-containing protein [Opitutaceae bacterium]
MKTPAGSAVEISAMNSCTLAVKVIPGASRDELCGWLGETAKIKLSAPPVEGRANDALIAFLAEKLGRPRRAVTLVRGAAARQKLVRIDGLTAAEVRHRLGAAG